MAIGPRRWRATEAVNCGVAVNYCARTTALMSSDNPILAAVCAQLGSQSCHECGASTRRWVRHRLRVWAGLVR